MTTEALYLDFFDELLNHLIFLDYFLWNLLYSVYWACLFMDRLDNCAKSSLTHCFQYLEVVNCRISIGEISDIVGYSLLPHRRNAFRFLTLWSKRWYIKSVLIRISRSLIKYLCLLFLPIDQRIFFVQPDSWTWGHFINIIWGFRCPMSVIAILCFFKIHIAPLLLRIFRAFRDLYLQFLLEGV